MRRGESAPYLGIISDTHGLVRPAACDALRGSHLIVHAGDVGSPQVLHELGTIAPVVAVRGNIDRDEWATALSQTRVIETLETRIYVLHDRNKLSLDPAAAGFDVVICGHSHKPSVEEREGVLHLNPGSAGPRRFRLPVCVARLHLAQGKRRAELIELRV